jgi:hypothetical protein
LARTVAEDAPGVVRAVAGDEDSEDEAALSERALEKGMLVPADALADGPVRRVADGCCAAAGVGSGAGTTAAGAASGGGASGVA